MLFEGIFDALDLLLSLLGRYLDLHVLLRVDFLYALDQLVEEVEQELRYLLDEVDVCVSDGNLHFFGAFVRSRYYLMPLRYSSYFYCTRLAVTF